MGPNIELTGSLSGKGEGAPWLALSPFFWHRRWIRDIDRQVQPARAAARVWGNFAAFRAKGRIALRRLFATTSLKMSDGAHLTAWVPREMKERFAVIARQQGLSDSALLKRMIDLALQSANAAYGGSAVTAGDSVSRASRLTVRLRANDQMLLRERASARGMAPATYVSVLVRSHLRSLAPLPKEELLAIRRAVSELGSIGRNLNQIARAANQGERVSGPGREDVKVMLRVCEGLRDHVRRLLSANLRAWEQGYGDPDP